MTMSDLKALILRTPPTVRGRLAKAAIVWVSVFTLTLAVLFVVSGKAFAACRPGTGDPTCPAGSAFRAKWDTGYFISANRARHGRDNHWRNGVRRGCLGPTEELGGARLNSLMRECHHQPKYLSPLNRGNTARP